MSNCSRCNQRHHTMLHIDTEGKANRSLIPKPSQPCLQANAGSSQSSNQTKSNVKLASNADPYEEHFDSIQTHFSQLRGTTILPTALVQVEHLGAKFTVRALLDAGSESSFISKRLQQILALPLESHCSQVSGLGGTVVGNSKGICVISVKSRTSDFVIRIKVVVVSKLTNFLPSRPVRFHNLDQIEKLNLADPYFYKPAAVDLIIGSDYLPFINLDGVKSNIGKCIEARESHFGWYLSGPEPRSEVKSFNLILKNNKDVILQDELRKFWELEEAEKTQLVSEADIYCENFFQKTTSRQTDGRYVVRLPFKEKFPNEIFLGPSRNTALAQYFRMEKTLAKTPDLRRQYINVLQE